MPAGTDWNEWERRFENFLAPRLQGADPGHDQAHILRVVATAKRLAAEEGALYEIIVPAAWLHDCVTVAKNSPRRSSASTLAADCAKDFLRRAGYPHDLLSAIAHAIRAHSFSANIPPETLEAKVVQDADRLDALGAIGIARCLMVGSDLGLALYDPDEPFPHHRTPDDSAYIVDHFTCKLCKLADTMQTTAGRVEARRRSRYMDGFLRRLATEIERSD